MHATDIVGYVYQVGMYCPDCILKFFTNNTTPGKCAEE